MNYFEQLNDLIKKDNSLDYNILEKHYKSIDDNIEILYFKNFIIINKNILCSIENDYILYSQEGDVYIVDKNNNNKYILEARYEGLLDNYYFKYYQENDNKEYYYDYIKNKIEVIFPQEEPYFKNFYIKKIEERKDSQSKMITLIDKDKKESFICYISHLESDWENEYTIYIPEKLDRKEKFKIDFNICQENIDFTINHPYMGNINREITKLINKRHEASIDGETLDYIINFLKEKSLNNINPKISKIYDFIDTVQLGLDINLNNLKDFFDKIIQIKNLNLEIREFINNNKTLLEKKEKIDSNFKFHLFSNIANKGFDNAGFFNHHKDYPLNELNRNVFIEVIEEVLELKKILNRDYKIKTSDSLKINKNIGLLK